ncbi:hypothetical protein Tco_0996584 [Tanacetum coccineum]
MASLDYRSNPLFTFKECSSCGTLHNKSCVFSKGGFVGKFVRDPNKTPDSSQRPPPNCPKCGDPVDGLYCRQCALLRKKLEEVFQDFQDTSKSSNDNTNVVNAPQEPFAFNQDPGENSSQSPPHIDHHLEERAANINTQLMQYSVIHQPPQEETNLEFLQDKRNLINSVQTFLRKFNRFSFYETPKVVSLAWETISEIEHAFEDKQYQPEGILELFRKLHDDVQNIHEELAEYINTPNWNRHIVYYDDDDDEDYTIASSIPLKDIIISGLPPCVAITPVLLTEEPVDSLMMEDEHLDTIPATESDEIFINSNDDDSSSDDNSLYSEEIDYVDASPLDFELVSLVVVEIVIPKVGGIDTDILLTIKDDILREKLLNVNILIAKIEALKDNPIPSFDFVTKSSSTSLNFFLEETNTFDNSLSESETFCFNLEEISSGSTTTCPDYSLSDYEAFYFDDDHIEKKSSGSTTTHFDFSLSKYDSFIFALLID